MTKTRLRPHDIPSQLQLHGITESREALEGSKDCSIDISASSRIVYPAASSSDPWKLSLAEIRAGHWDS